MWPPMHVLGRLVCTGLFVCSMIPIVAIAQTAETVFVYAAGSLRAPLT
jgi:ABC-type molybdate transport system substrate-binding protein